MGNANTCFPLFLHIKIPIDRPAADIEAYCVAAERFSIMAAALGDVVSEIDVNPVIVQSEGCIAVDALVVGRQFKPSED